MTYQRKRVDLSSAVIWDSQTRTNWLIAQFSVPTIEGMPKEVLDRHRDMAVREIDILMGYGITDALLAGWVVIPPVEARSHDRLGYGFPEVNRHIIERRVRLQQPNLRDHNFGSWAVGQVLFTVEVQDYRGDSLSHPWSTYKPEYEETDGNGLGGSLGS